MSFTTTATQKTYSTSTTTATYPSYLAPKTLEKTSAKPVPRPPSGGSPGAKTKVTAASEPAFASQTTASTARSSTGTAAFAPQSTAPRTRSSTGTAFASQTTASTTRSATGTASASQTQTASSRSRNATGAAPAEGAGSVPSMHAFDLMFYRKIAELGEIAEQYPLYDLAGKRLREDQVSASISEWILSALEKYIRGQSLSDEELHLDVIDRLKKLAGILVEVMNNTQLKKPRLDRNKYTWDQAIIDDWIYLSRLAVATLGINQFRMIDQTVNGVTRKIEVINSPIDGEPMSFQVHDFAQAVIDWYKSLPWDIISPSRASSTTSSAEAEFKTGSEQSLTVVSSSGMTGDQVMRFLSYTMNGPAIRLKLNSLERADRAREATAKWKKDAAKLHADQQKLFNETKKQFEDLKKTMRDEMRHVEEASRAREANLRATLEDSARRIAAVEADNNYKSTQLNQASAALSAAHAAAAAAQAAAAATQQRVVHVEHVVHHHHRKTCVLQ